MSRLVTDGSEFFADGKPVVQPEDEIDLGTVSKKPPEDAPISDSGSDGGAGSLSLRKKEGS